MEQVLRSETPLETRAFVAPRQCNLRLPTRQAMTEIRALAGRGYNTVLIPAMADGEAPFGIDHDGNFDPHRGALPELLHVAVESGLSPWLLVDPFSAGAAGAQPLGATGRANRRWLQRTPDGRTIGLPGTTAPGVFCWMDNDFRRFVGNMLAICAEAFPIDALVIDLRALPEVREEPSQWTFLGIRCLERIEEELRIDVDRVLERGDRELAQQIEEWRLQGLHAFLSKAKARVNTTRPDIPVFARVALQAPSPMVPGLPWTEPFASGVFAGALFDEPPVAARKHLAELEHAAQAHLPFLLMSVGEEDIVADAQQLRTLPMTGWVSRQAPIQGGPLPNLFAPKWNASGCLEADPIAAAAVLVEYLANELKSCEQAGTLFRELEALLHVTNERLGPRDVRKVREGVADLLSRIESEDVAVPDMARHALVEAERLVRLMALVPIPPILA